MRAVVIHEFGPPSVLVASEVEDLALAAGQVLIDVEVANITFVETQLRAGKPPHPSMLPRLPVILGNGVGGLVLSTGAEVDPSLIGQRVVSSLRGTGGYAERAVADSAGLVAIPLDLTTADAVALLADGRTAMLLASETAIRPGETVLVEAAAGGVGSLLVQLASGAGAHVIGAAGGERKLAVARELGARTLVNYLDPLWTLRLHEQVERVDVVFDGVGGAIGRAAFELLGHGGRFVPFGMASGAFAPVSDGDAEARGVTLHRNLARTPDELRAFVQAALNEAVAGRLRPLIGQTFPLEHAADAHLAIEQRTTIGKTLLLTASAV
ncbi:MAG TPA: zinc-binding dehydrogenase [Mycobacterium sp.]|jgi:NADPH2:quinone reductase|nr:zinc-binding dehydrogenase [Mycobacterium sp.]